MSAEAGDQPIAFEHVASKFRGRSRSLEVRGSPCAVVLLALLGAQLLGGAAYFSASSRILPRETQLRTQCILYVSTDLGRDGRTSCPTRGEMSAASAHTITSSVMSSSFVPGLPYWPSFTLSDGYLLTNVSVAARDPISPAWHVLASEPADEAEPLSARVLEARRAARRGPASGAREVGEEEDFGLAMDDSGGPILRRAADLMFDGDGDDRHAPPAPTRRRLLKGSRPRSRLFRERYLLDSPDRIYYLGPRPYRTRWGRRGLHAVPPRAHTRVFTRALGIGPRTRQSGYLHADVNDYDTDPALCANRAFGCDVALRGPMTREFLDAATPLQLARDDLREVALAIRAVVVMDPATAASAAAGGVVEDPILLASLVTREGQPEEGIARWALRAVFLLLLPAAAALWHLFVRGPGSVARGRALATAPLLPGGTLALATAPFKIHRSGDLTEPPAPACCARSRARSLQVETNDILSLRGIGAYPALRTLNVYNNNLTSLRGIEACPNLHALDASNNDITDADAVGNLTNLRWLNLASNNLRSLRLAPLPSIEFLDLSDNDLKHVRPLSNLPSLRVLDLRHNDLEDVTGLDRLGELTALDLSSNDLEDAGPVARLAETCPALLVVDLRDNDFEEQSKGLIRESFGTRLPRCSVYL